MTVGLGAAPTSGQLCDDVMVIGVRADGQSAAGEWHDVVPARLHADVTQERVHVVGQPALLRVKVQQRSKLLHQTVHGVLVIWQQTIGSGHSRRRTYLSINIHTCVYIHT